MKALITILALFVITNANAYDARTQAELDRANAAVDASIASHHNEEIKWVDQSGYDSPKPAAVEQPTNAYCSVVGQQIWCNTY